ncbi:acyltransferase family protein [Sphingomonas montana]|uniref:acyltransferase family protein n=1 Tax=Sphingomonas montana TaxID=1843236 RepID=UPI00096F9746|nr:acyltransferase [Sphingomonas montana]
MTIRTAHAPPTGRVRSLQALRGLAAAMVVLAHAIEHAPGRSADPITLTGRFGVDIFFVISGFVIAYVAGDRPFRPGRFMMRRIWRVAPLYWGLTLIVAAAALATPGAFKTTAFAFDYFVKSLLFIPAALPGTIDWRPLFKLGWTLNYEMFFYLVVAALFWCRSMLQRAIVLSVVMGLLVLLSVFVAPSSGILAFYANLNLLPFISGVWLAVLWQTGLIARVPRPAAWLVLTAAIVATLAFYRIEFWTVRRLDGHLLMSVAATLIGAAVLLFEDMLARFRVPQWLGDISYSLYLSHMFVVGTAWAVLNRLSIGVDSVLGALAIVGIFGVSLVVAQLSYRYVEQPLMRVETRRRDRAKPHLMP